MYPCSPGGCGLVQPSLQLRGHHLTPSLSRRLTVAAVQTQRTPYYRTSHIARTADQTGALQTPPRRLPPAARASAGSEAAPVAASRYLPYSATPCTAPCFFRTLQKVTLKCTLVLTDVDNVHKRFTPHSALFHLKDKNHKYTG